MSKKAQQNASRRAAAKRVARQKALAKKAQAGNSAPSKASNQEPIFGTGGMPDFFSMKWQQEPLGSVMPTNAKLVEEHDTAVPEQFYLVKVELNNADNKVWRRILISNKERLSDLHNEIKRVFTWDDDCEAFFYDDATCRNLISCTELRPGHFFPDCRLDQVLKSGKKLGYVLDQFSGWQHTITVEQVVADRSELPADLVWSQGNDVEQFLGSDAFSEIDEETRNEAAKYKGAYTFKVELLGTKEPVWRTIVCPASDYFGNLSNSIHDSFGWTEGYYPGAFYSDPECQQVLSSALNATGYFGHDYLGAVLKPGMQFIFTCGIEQSKRFLVTVERWASCQGEAEAGTIRGVGDFNKEDLQPDVSYLLKVERSNSTTPLWFRVLLNNKDNFEDLFEAIKEQLTRQQKTLAAFYLDSSFQVKLCAFNQYFGGIFPNPKLFKWLEPGLKFGFSSGPEQQYTITVEQVVADKSELPSDLQWSQGVSA